MTMKRIAVIIMMVSACITMRAQTRYAPFRPLPNENQLRWQDMEMYAFIHYSLNTYTDQEWGFGNEDLKLFNPSDLDCRQWARVCKQAGMKGIIFTAKHHCGFCMWPSAYTEYSVKNTPWKNGKGDVVRELADACREEGLKFAVYLSPWDRNHPEYGGQEYVTYFRNQLRELLTNYGEIFEVWFDGANGGDGWYGGANETRKIDGKTYYGWAETFRMIRELQPKAVIWNDGGDRGDLRWVGTEAGNVGETNWSLMPSKGDTPWHMLHYGVEDGDVWCPGETNTSIRPGWFYHETENEHVKSLSKLMDTYYKSVGRNSTLLLNFPIAPNGRIHPNDSLRGIAFKKMIDEVFKTNLVEKAKIQTKASETIIDFGKPTVFNRFLAEEDIALGQRVKKFTLEALVDGKWQSLKDALVENGDGLTTIGHRRIICFPTVKATQLRFTITDAKAEPIIKKMGVYLAPELNADIPNSGEKKSSGLHIFFSSPTQMMIDWDKEQTITSFRYLPPHNTKDGTITHYTLWASSDWSKWTKLASGEFSNIVNNPIWQTIKFPATKARILKFDAERLAAGERMAFGDIEVVTELNAQGFKNPVLPGFHADPSVCRVGDDFYLVNSTFQYFPGVPVFHSKDLVNWKQIGNCLTRPSQVDLKETDGNSGIYAPTIRYNNGRFYMVTTVFPSRRHFYVWTDHPDGEWSEPIVIDFAIGSCDPTLYFEDDKCYFLWKEGDIKICEIDVETGKQLGEIHHLGTGLGGRYPEGPHIYKKDGYYYLLLAEGGTEHGHHVNILRSRSLFGPYESNPANPILSHFNMKMQNSPIQGLGHADLVQATDSTWWMICLGYRTSGYLQHVMGRETMLAPVTWEKGGWPVVNGDGTLQTDMKCRTLPLVPMAKDHIKENFDYIKRNVPKDSYHSLGLPMGWMSLCNPDYTKYSLSERKGWLRLRPSTTDLTTANPTFVARRQTELNFSATALLDLSHLTEGMQAGITAYAAPLNHYDVVAEKRNGTIYIKSNVRLGQTSHSEKDFPLNGIRAYLRITSDKDYYYLQASSDGTNFIELAKMEYRFLSTETIGGFTGVMLGLFAQSNSKTNGYVDIDWFEYK